MAFIHIPKLRKAKTRTNLIAIIYLFSEARIIKRITNKINFIFYLLFNGFRLNLSNVPLVANLHEHENEDWFASEKGWILCIANIISLKVKSLFTLMHFDKRSPIAYTRRVSSPKSRNATCVTGDANRRYNKWKISFARGGSPARKVGETIFRLANRAGIRPWPILQAHDNI